MKAVSASVRKILVWDVPTRLFHWLLVIAFAGALLTADSERHRDLHVAFGATMLVLIAFRLVWGVIGTRYARFRAFVFGPRAVLHYAASLATLGWLRERVSLGSPPARPVRYLGHTPAGSWAIWAMLALGVLAGATGAAAYNDVGGKWLEEAHAALAWTLLATVGVHVAGVVLSSVLHRENLVTAMITGRKRGEASQAIAGSRWYVGVALAALVLAIWFDVVPIPGAGRHMAKVAHERGTSAAHAEDD
jgi:cytochrome b